MNLYRLALTPWVATPRSARWLVMFLLVLVSLGAVLGHVYQIPHPRRLDAVMLGIGNAALWLLLLPNTMLLAQAAQRLHMPGIGRDVVWSLLLYVLVCIGAPLLFQFPRGAVLTFAIAQVLVAAGAMSIMVLPYYLVFGLYLLFVFGHRALKPVFSIPGLSDPRFVVWGGVLAVALLVILVWRWRQLLRGDYSDRGWRAPGLMSFRRSLGSAQSDPLTDAGLIRSRPDWMTACADLHDAGPEAPIRSLRLALGGIYLPQTLGGRLRHGITWVLVLVVMLLMYFMSSQDDGNASWLLHLLFSREGFLMLSSLFAVLSLLLVMMPVELLGLRWSRANAELSVLALLPGLDRSMHARRALLRMVMVSPAVRVGLLLLAGWLAVISLHVDWSVAWAMLLVAVGSLIYLHVMALGIIGGRPLPGFGKGLLMIFMFVLLSLTVVWAQLSDVQLASLALDPNQVLTIARDALVVAWLLLLSLLLWLGVRGWRAFEQRPHPFLPN